MQSERRTINFFRALLVIPRDFKQAGLQNIMININTHFSLREKVNYLEGITPL